MLRFRPIAPKPAAPPPPPAAVGAGVGGMTGAGRARRKAGGGGGREGARKRGRKARDVVAGAFKEEDEGEERKRRSPPRSERSARPGSVVTLPLMPETPERREAAPSEDAPSARHAVPAWLRGGGGEVVAPRPVRPAGSWVTVECVTDTWAAAGVGDGVVRAALEAEGAFPGFISDAWDRVVWANEAYRRMVVGPAAEDGGGEEVRVALATKGTVPAGAACRAFTCLVRVRYASRRRGLGSLTAPCDVWRLDDGGHAWRLDIEAALSLSLGR